MITFRSKALYDKQACIILLSEEQIKKNTLTHLPAQIRSLLKPLVDNKLFKAENGQLCPAVHKKQTLLFVGVGKDNERTQTSLKISVKNALISSFLTHCNTLELIAHQQKDSIIVPLIESIMIGSYKWNKYFSKKSKKEKEEQKNVFLIALKKKLYQDAVTICEGNNLARDLVNDNADSVTSTHFEKVVRALIKGKKNISLEILNKKEMKQKGLGFHLAVNQGSVNEPKLIIVKYQGSAKKGDFTALVGKGLTFDTGGLNLKPTGGIESMRIDMSGAAAVVGALKNTLDLKLKKNAIFVLGVAENVTGSKAYKPGDVIIGYAGKSVEVANTDAEGRLVLADAISYTVKNYKPKRIIDIATLTGACVVALGHDYTGLITTDDNLSRDLVYSSNETNDRVWRLPTYPELKDSVKSEIADIKNLGTPRGAAGTLTAAEFLRQFTEATPWAHLDIAGTSFVDGAERWYFSHGATGAGVRLLTHYLQHHA